MAYYFVEEEAAIFSFTNNFYFIPALRFIVHQESY